MFSDICVADYLGSNKQADHSLRKKQSTRRLHDGYNTTLKRPDRNVHVLHRSISQIFLVSVAEFARYGNTSEIHMSNPYFTTDNFINTHVKTITLSLDSELLHTHQLSASVDHHSTKLKYIDFTLCPPVRTQPMLISCRVEDRNA